VPHSGTFRAKEGSTGQRSERALTARRTAGQRQANAAGIKGNEEPKNLRICRAGGLSSSAEFAAPVTAVSVVLDVSAAPDPGSGMAYWPGGLT
jgi:hypothetical protein